MDRRKVLIGSAAAVGLAAVGGVGLMKARRKRHSGPVIKHGELDPTIRYSGPQAHLSELGPEPEFDVCIIGSGPAGTFLARELLAKGVRTAVLDAGLSPADSAQDPRYATLTRCLNVGPVDYPVAITRAWGPGGTSMLWTGRTPRLMPIDFEVNAYTPAGAAWPVSYEQMEPWYSRAEDALRVQGDPRSAIERSRPLPKIASEPKCVYRIYDELGLTSEVSATSLSESGGPVRLSSDVLPQVMASPSATFLVGTSAHRLLADRADAVSAVDARDLEGNIRRIRARVFVLAAGGIESSRRLLLSRSDAHPQGIGNTRGRVGKGFNEHPGVELQCVIGDQQTSTILQGLGREPHSGSARSFDLYEPFKRDGYGSILLIARLREDERKRLVLKLSAICEMEPSDSNCVRLAPSPDAVDAYGDALPELSLGFSERDQATMQRARKLLDGYFDRLGAREVVEMPMHWSHHHMGATRMGEDPATSVVDSNLRVHGVENLYVLSSGAWVTSGASNPTLLITAFALRLAEHLRGRLESRDLPEPARGAGPA